MTCRRCYLPAISLGTVVLCTDGSELPARALAEGFPVLAGAPRVVIVTVIEQEDETLVAGTGFAGGVMSPEELDRLGLERKAECASRGRGLVKRAVPGSVPDHVVRHGPCPVVISSGRGRADGSPAQ